VRKNHAGKQHENSLLKISIQKHWQQDACQRKANTRGRHRFNPSWCFSMFHIWCTVVQHAFFIRIVDKILSLALWRKPIFAFTFGIWRPRQASIKQLLDLFVRRTTETNTYSRCTHNKLVVSSVAYHWLHNSIRGIWPTWALHDRISYQIVWAAIASLISS
jgi:hypothetical protein